MTAGQITSNTIVDVIALSSIYSMILERVTNITFDYENFMDMIVELETLYEEFKNINDVYIAEQQKVFINTPIDFLNVFSFSITQDINGSFELINRNLIVIKSGDTIVAYGKTGCGKSTLIKMLTGKIIIPENPIRFSNGKEGYLNSIGYQTDKAMANGFSLNEVTLTENYDSINFMKLFEILKGLHLYDEFLRMIKEENITSEGLTDDRKVIELMKKKKIREFSSGQMQRLAIAKLLYSLDDTIQLVALDEPFNRLDDATCASCMEFVYEYVHRIPRILLIATHQVDICCPYATIKISFDENMSKSILKVQTT
jgi:energy-coupling factor transporter ATP-binding protein EcfA2